MKKHNQKNSSKLSTNQSSILNIAPSSARSSPQWGTYNDSSFKKKKHNVSQPMISSMNYYSGFKKIHQIENWQSNVPTSFKEVQLNHYQENLKFTKMGGETRTDFLSKISKLLDKIENELIEDSTFKTKY
jgi:NAD+--asparagine ADP-ribosyltransferase